MRKWIVALLAGAVLLFPTLVLAQGSLTLDRVEVDIWPEYDQPQALIIYHIFLPPNAPLPANMTIRIPASAGDPTNLAYRNEGDLYNLNYTRTALGDWSNVTFEAPSNEIQLEYYDPGLGKNGANRAFTYLWPGDYAVTVFSFQVQQPIGATQMRINPTLGEGIPGENGLLYYTRAVGAVKFGENLSLQISYQKNNNDLSIQSLKVGPTAPINARTPGRFTLEDVIPWVVGGLGLLLIGGGGWWYWQSGRSSQVDPTRKRHTAKTQAAAESLPVETAAGIFCHRCGKRASTDDIFCRSCGARLRKEG